MCVYPAILYYSDNIFMNYLRNYVILGTTLGTGYYFRYFYCWWLATKLLTDV